MWSGKANSKLTHKSIKEMLDSSTTTHIFSRKDSNDPKFEYLGQGEAVNWENTSPVKVQWKIQ